MPQLRRIEFLDFKSPW